jgi:hypothetical protein
MTPTVILARLLFNPPAVHTLAPNNIKQTDKRRAYELANSVCENNMSVLSLAIFDCDLMTTQATALRCLVFPVCLEMFNFTQSSFPLAASFKDNA